MPFHLTCPQGHRWELADYEQGATTELRILCPVCGAAVENPRPSSSEQESTAARVMPPATEVWEGDETDPAGSSRTLPPKAVSTARSASAFPEVPGYELLAELGRGGMGVVYRARHKGLKRQVALKMILGGAHAGEEQLARFRAEAEAVARLKHPHIIQIYDVGEADGLSYFSLEFVEGGSLADKLNGLPQPPRLAALFVEILSEAIHYAHQHGIIHRDLKPANILLSTEVGGRSAVTKLIGSTVADFSLRTTAYGQPKITDFGLARPLEGGTGLTQAGAIIGTPSYMAPEQAESKGVGPAADVYALGAVLYEMLTGRPPFRAETPLETIRQLLADEPVPPRQLQPKLPIDLESICLKCLEKEPGKRYDTALALADDLRRFLADEPTLARPTSRFRRLVKWVRRRPALAGLVAVSALAGLTLAGVILRSNVRLTQERDYALRQKQRAELSSERAQAAVDQLLTRVGDEKLKNVPLLEELQRDLLEEALKFNQQFLEDSGEDPAVRRQTGRAYFRAGRIRAMLGRHEEAAVAFREAINLQEQLIADVPDRPEYQRELAASYQGLAGQLADMGRRPEADQLYGQALSLLEPLVLLFPNEPAYRSDLALLYHRQGAYRRALELQEKLVNDFPKVVGYRADRAATLLELAIFLATTKPKEAEPVFRQAIRSYEELAADFPREVDHRQGLVRSQTNLATFFADTGQLQEAEKTYGQNLTAQEALAADFPRVPFYRRSLAKTYFNLGIVSEKNSHRPEAVKAYRRSVSLFEKLTAEVPNVPAYRAELIGSLNNLAGALNDSGQKTEAEETYRRAIGIFEDLVGEFPSERYYQSEFGRILSHLAVMLRDRNALDEAGKLLQRAIHHQQAALKLRPDHGRYPLFLSGHYVDLAEVRLRQGDYTAAAEIADKLTGVDRPENYYNAACLFSRCVPLAEKESWLAESQRRELARSYGDRALDRLSTSIKKGFKDIAHLKKDPDLDPVRSRADFQKLLHELEKQTDSGGK